MLSAPTDAGEADTGDQDARFATYAGPVSPLTRRMRHSRHSRAVLLLAFDYSLGAQEARDKARFANSTASPGDKLIGRPDL